MRTRATAILMTLLVGFLAAGVLFPSDAGALGAIRRLAADFQSFDVTETLTNQTAVSVCPGPFPASCAPGVPDGLKVYEKTVFVPSSENTLYVTISSTVDTHFGAQLWLSCRFNGAFCNPGTGGAAATPPGWISANRMNRSGVTLNCNNGGGGTGDCHDNAVYYTWCIPLPGRGTGTHTVAIHLASSHPFGTVAGDGLGIAFMEATHYYIDASKIQGPNRCSEIPSESFLVLPDGTTIP